MEEQQSPQVFTPHFSEVPVDVYRFFDMDLGTAEGKGLDKLKAISRWAFEGDITLGDGLTKLRQLEIQLGVPRIGEGRQDKIFNWVKLQNNINELRKRQEAI